MPTPTEIVRQAEQFDEEDWLTFLDEVDAVHRRRAEHEKPDEPASGARDDVAAWTARKHFIVDSSVREIWYLPVGAPADEIRFLEVHERFLGPLDKITAVDFGNKVAGFSFVLSVADISTDQLDECKRDPSKLPGGWSLTNARSWTRRT